MEDMKYNYPIEIKKMVSVLYGRESAIYSAMMGGEKISRLIKLSIKQKGGKVFRIRDKNDLFKACKSFEQEVENLNEKNQGL